MTPEQSDATVTPIEASFIVKAMQRRLDEFGRTLVNGEAMKYKQLKNQHDLGGLVNMACWDLAQTDATRDDSKELRGLYFTHKIIEAAARMPQAHHGGESESWNQPAEPFQLHFPYADAEYYGKVDRVVAHQIGNVVLANPGVCHSLEADQDQFGLPIGGFAVIRHNVVQRALEHCPNGMPNQAIYSVVPETTL